MARPLLCLRVQKRRSRPPVIGAADDSRDDRRTRMSLHLFSTPTQCTHCGTTVDDPKVDRCPSCSHLLKERRAPRRIAGVEQRYGNLRFLLGFIRLLGVTTIVVGVLAFFYTNDGSEMQRVLTLLGTFLVAVVMFAVAAFFDVALDVEENTRSAFRVQQLILEQLTGEEEGGREVAHAGVTAAAERASAAAAATATATPAAP